MRTTVEGCSEIETLGALRGELRRFSGPFGSKEPKGWVTDTNPETTYPSGLGGGTNGIKIAAPR